MLYSNIFTQAIDQNYYYTSDDIEYSYEAIGEECYNYIVNSVKRSKKHSPRLSTRSEKNKKLTDSIANCTLNSINEEALDNLNTSLEEVKQEKQKFLKFVSDDWKMSISSLKSNSKIKIQEFLDYSSELKGHSHSNFKSNNNDHYRDSYSGQNSANHKQSYDFYSKSSSNSNKFNSINMNDLKYRKLSFENKSYLSK